MNNYSVSRISFLEHFILSTKSVSKTLRSSYTYLRYYNEFVTNIGGIVAFLNRKGRDCAAGEAILSIICILLILFIQH